MSKGTWNIKKDIFTVADEDNMVLLSAGIVEILIKKAICKHRPLFFLKLDDIIDEDYVEYICCVLKSNWGREGFYLSGLRKTSVNKRNIFKVFMVQIRKLSMNDKLCFYYAGAWKPSYKGSKIFIWSARGFYGWCRKKPSICYFKMLGGRLKRIVFKYHSG